MALDTCSSHAPRRIAWSPTMLEGRRRFHVANCNERLAGGVIFARNFWPFSTINHADGGTSNIMPFIQHDHASLNSPFSRQQSPRCREIPESPSYWLTDSVGSVPLPPTADNRISTPWYQFYGIQSLPRFGYWWSIYLVIILTIGR